MYYMKLKEKMALAGGFYLHTIYVIYTQCRTEEFCRVERKCKFFHLIFYEVFHMINILIVFEKEIWRKMGWRITFFFN